MKIFWALLAGASGFAAGATALLWPESVPWTGIACGLIGGFAMLKLVK